MLNGGQADVQWQRRLKFGPSKTCLKCNSIFVYEIIFPIEIDHQSKESNGDGVMRVGRVSKWSRVTKWWNRIQYSDSIVWPKKIKDGCERSNLSGPLTQLMRSRLRNKDAGIPFRETSGFRRKVDEDCPLLGYCPEGRE